MEKSKKIGVITIPVVILIVLVSSSLPQNSDLTSENISDVLLSNNDSNLEVPLVSPMIGVSDAPVTIFAFNDYQCASCKFWYENEYPEISKNLIETKKANVIFLDASPLGDDSILISQATFCADDQEKYSEYQEILFMSQQEIDIWAKSDQLKSFAMDLDLNLNQFENCLDSGKYEKDVQSNIDYANSIGVDKVPIFKIVHSEGREHILKGSIPSTLFEDAINRFQN